METNFYVGQEVVAIKDHSQGVYKKGDEFVIQGIKKTCCNCCLDIGMSYFGDMTCTKCGNDYDAFGVTWFNQSSFSPKQQLSETTYNDVQEWIKQGKEIAILN